MSKKYYIFIGGQLERLYNAISDTNLTLICFFSFKNQNWEMYCRVINSGLEFPVRSNKSHYILGSRGIRGGVRENSAYCFLLRMVHLLFFIHNGRIWWGTIQPWPENGTHFSCYESLPKRYKVQMSIKLFKSHMILYVTQCPATSLVA